MRALLVDDEQHCHDALVRLLPPDIQVLGSAYSVADAYQKAINLQPEIVFLDVELPDGTGFDLLDRFPELPFFVIFVTAYNKYAEAAFRFGALHFITKPVDPAILAQAMERLRNRLEEKITLEQLKIAIDTFKQAQTQKMPRRISVPTSKGLIMVPTDKIIRLDADANMTEFHVLDQKNRLIASNNLGYYADSFELYPIFMKVHRSHLVNLLYVVNYVKGENYLLMVDDSKVPVSRQYREELERRLNEL